MYIYIYINYTVYISLSFPFCPIYNTVYISLSFPFSPIHIILYISPFHSLSVPYIILCIYIYFFISLSFSFCPIYWTVYISLSFPFCPIYHTVSIYLYIYIFLPFIPFLSHSLPMNWFEYIIAVFRQPPLAHLKVQERVGFSSRPIPCCSKVRPITSLDSCS